VIDFRRIYAYSYGFLKNYVNCKIDAVDEWWFFIYDVSVMPEFEKKIP